MIRSIFIDEQHKAVGQGTNPHENTVIEDHADGVVSAAIRVIAARVT